MYADDRVLVGVVNRAKDFEIARRHHWYRIPEGQLPRGLNAEYIAFFLSGKRIQGARRQRRLFRARHRAGIGAPPRPAAG